MSREKHRPPLAFASRQGSCAARATPIGSATLDAAAVLFEQLNDGACKTYLIASGGQAMLVDPVLEGVDGYLAEVERRHLRLRYVLDTHVHADHISGSAAVRDRTGADFVMHRHSASACANVRVDAGDTIELGALTIRVMHTPGHTQDSITLVFPDRILTGDFLFIGEGGAGRTDLPGGDAGEHWDALQKLSPLPHEMLIYPAHDYHGRAHSTLGEERLNNPRLEARSRDDYVAWLDSLELGPADWMADVVKANYACALDPSEVWIPVDQPACEVKGTAGNVNMQLVSMMTVDALVATMARGGDLLILDVREKSEFDGDLGHILKAQLIPVGELAARLPELDAFKSRTIVVVCRGGGRSATGAAILSVAGFEDVYSLDGGMLAYNQHRVDRA